MIEVINKNHGQLADLCQRFHVKTLELFGSATDGTFDPTRSDLDFLLEFLPEAASRSFHGYFDFKDELERLFGRKIRSRGQRSGTGKAGCAIALILLNIPHFLFWQRVWHIRTFIDPAVNHLHRLTRAMLEYEKEQGTFPPHALFSKDGVPLLSWRV
jgi:predicted nucleotidyltransferase